MMEKKNNLYSYLAGGLIGGFLGVFVIFLLEKKLDSQSGKSLISKKQVSKMGIGMISLLWSLIEPDSKNA